MASKEFFALRKQIIERDFARMNDRQKEAIFHVDGPLLILAGAGSGKTTVIVNRIANIVKYGRAYTSTEVSEEPTPQQMKLMRRYLDGDSSVLFDTLGKVLPDYDTERVHASDAKKLFSWYKVLLVAGKLEPSEEKTEEHHEAAEPVAVPAPEKPKRKAPAPKNNAPKSSTQAKSAPKRTTTAKKAI